MDVLAIQPRGYCYGVVNAIKTAKQARLDYPDKKIYVLGMIVHNKHIMRALDELDIITLDDKTKSREELIDEIAEGVVILSAHGSANIVKKKALAKGLIVYDATCKDVIKTHLIIEEYLNDGYDIIYYGKENHPEAIAALSLNPTKIHLITALDDLEKLVIDTNKIFMTNQTTISIIEAKKIFERVREIFPSIVISEEICNATRIRQEAILALDDDVDLVYVVGDPASNNSNKLAQLAKQEGVTVFMIETVEDIKISDLKNKKKVAVTSGASTPTYLTNMVIDYLKQFDYENKKTHLKPQLEYHKILS